MTSMLQHLDELLGIKSGPMVIKSLLVLLAGCVAYYLTGALFGLLLRFLLPLRLKQTRRFKKPLALWGSLATSYFLMAFFLDYLLVLTPYFVTIASLLKVVASSWLLYDVGGLIIDFFSKKEGVADQHLHHALLALLGRMVQVATLVVGALIFLSKLGLDPKALLASTSVCSIGLALAAQDAARNIFSSVIIFLDRPFKKGDSIVAGSIVGEVEEIGLRATRLRTPHNGLLYVPNTLLANGQVESRRYALCSNQVTVAADTPTERLTAVIKDLEAGLAADLHTQGQPTIRLERLVQTGIVLYCSWQLKATATAEHHHRLLLWLLQRIEQHNVTVVAT